MNQILIRVVSRYAPIITFPVAVILGFIGYSFETAITDKKTPYLENSIEDQREKRFMNNPESEYHTNIPKNIFERNDPKNLK
ncbi:small integral membrane 12-A [Brachionus plicatilis]|uniref:Small integral membrane 12-A n=1 Tax=Brachionus plicatilis TaxID=10195 RepID=A0A3M7T7F4_BRAPC|nr:small integral membrane 12-A [Brachionus plicatilis]